MFTRNHMELIAKVMKETKPAKPKANHMFEQDDYNDYVAFTMQWEKDVKAIAIMISNNNARFDFNKFYAACDLDMKLEVK